MRVLITSGIYPPDIGGPATYVPTIAQHLIDRGCKVSVVSAAECANMEQHADVSWSLKRFSRHLPLPARLVDSFRLVFHEMRHSDVVLANGLYGLVATASALLRKPVAMKIVGDPAWERAISRGYSTQTIEEFQINPTTRRAQLLSALRSMNARSAARIITPSQYLASLVRGWGVSSERISVVRNAIRVQSPPHLAKIPGRLITVCRLVPWKGVREILEVVQQLPLVSLDIVGDGPLRSELELTARNLNISDRVSFLGSLDRSAVLERLSAASVCVLNSSYEGLPHVLIESVMMGTPVVARDAGGCGEVVVHGRTGLLVPPGEPLLTAVQSALADNAFPAFQPARHELISSFSLEAMLDQTFDLLVRINQPRAPSP